MAQVARYGGRSSVGRARDCDSRCRGFDPHRPPHISKGARFNSLAPFLFYGWWFVAQRFGSKGRAFRRVQGLAVSVPTAGHVRGISRQGDGSQSLLYIEAVEAEPWRDGLYSSSRWSALLHSHL